MIAEALPEVFADAGVEGFVHAREIGTDGPDLSHGADDQGVPASVFKIPVPVAYATEVAAGRLDEAERTRVTSRYRIGGIGTAGCADDVEMSWRDLVLFMMTMSDNAATDVVFHRVGQAAVDAVLAKAGLERTRILGCCKDLFASVAADLGTGDAEACAQVRAIMVRQIRPHRLGSGFPADVQVAAKTGTLPGVRNEAGVVTHPDGRSHAVAVFTRSQSLDQRDPAADAVIGRAGRLAVDHLRRTP